MTPIISVVVTCYNQEKYIKRCLDGIVMQKDCPAFEVIIGDDCSTDDTRKIIKQYTEKYKNFTLLNRKKNMGMLHNLKDCFAHCNGEYIAICEGDDYWTDVHKLKKQYDALSKDSNAYICFSDIKLLSDGKYQRCLHEQKSKLKKCVTIYDLFEHNYIGNFSCVMYKKQALNFIPKSYYENKLNADYTMHLYMLNASKYAIFLKEPMSVYRILPDSISHKDTYPLNSIKLVRMLQDFNATTHNKYQENIDKFCTRLFYSEPVVLQPQNYKRIFGISFACRSKRIMIGIGLKKQ